LIVLIDLAFHARSKFWCSVCNSKGVNVDKSDAGSNEDLKAVQVMSALDQLLRGVAWGKLDVMVVDMPPGTGDAQISISQKVPLAGE
jgi:Mrp family chromosome partitioning ATPase